MNIRAALHLLFGLVLVASFGSCSASPTGNNRVGSGGQGTGASGGTAPAGGLGGIGATSGVGGIVVDGGGTSGGAAAGGTGAIGGGNIDECPGPLDVQTIGALEAGGGGGARWLYPYNGTVWPRGLISPVLQWEGPAPQAVLLRMRSSNFTYRGCFGAVPNKLQIPQGAWDAATSSAVGVQDPLTVDLVFSANGQIIGPITETWAIAPAAIKGSIFYNTYGSPQVGNNGAVMRINPGQAQPQPYLTVNGLAPFGPCYSCHTVSANGQHMIAAYHQYPNITYTSASYNVGPNANPPALASNLDEAGFSAIFPDGSRFLTNGSPSNSTANPLFPMGPGNVVGMVGPRTSRLFDAGTGQAITATGMIQYAKMPMFSPDGTKVVFNDHDGGQGHSLSVMDFNAGNNTFSNKQEIFRNASLWPGWPFFTPDNKKVIFVVGTADDYVGAHPLRPIVANSDLWIVDVASKQSNVLSRANGFDGSTSYMPYPGRDEHWEFFPTVSPVAAGGYYWLFFTSRRNYGNTVVGAQDLAAAKQIWVSAIDIDAPAGSDPSHPAFWLPGQEPNAGNVRAFAALEPCRADGAQCSTGIDCCCGRCDANVCGCVPPTECSKLDEKCTTNADCCDQTQRCIAGFCAIVIPK